MRTPLLEGLGMNAVTTCMQSVAASGRLAAVGALKQSAG